jgi:hypothetical protein
VLTIANNHNFKPNNELDFMQNTTNVPGRFPSLNTNICNVSKAACFHLQVKTLFSAEDAETAFETLCV